MGCAVPFSDAGMLSGMAALMTMPMATGMLSGVFATTLTMGTLGFSRGGFSVNHMDIAPRYAGMVMGISNTAGEGASRVCVCVCLSQGQPLSCNSLHIGVARCCSCYTCVWNETSLSEHVYFTNFWCFGRFWHEYSV